MSGALRWASRPSSTGSWHRLLRAFTPQEQSRTRGYATAKDTNKGVVVQLLCDVKGYGPSQSYMLIPKALMRNVWFPQKWAAYIPHREHRRVKEEALIIERRVDFLRGNEPELDEMETEPTEDSIPVLAAETESPDRLPRGESISLSDRETTA